MLQARIVLGSLPGRRDAGELRGAIVRALESRPWVQVERSSPPPTGPRGLATWKRATLAVVEVSGTTRCDAALEAGVALAADVPLILVRDRRYRPPFAFEGLELASLVYSSPPELERQLRDLDLVRPRVVARLLRDDSTDGPGCEPHALRALGAALLGRTRLDPRVVFEVAGASDVSELQIRLSIEVLESLGFLRAADDRDAAWDVTTEGTRRLPELVSGWAEDEDRESRPHPRRVGYPSDSRSANR